MVIRFFDMFSGIGGFRSGLERIGGFQCIGHCEIDKAANQAYCAIYAPEGEVYYEDATKIDPRTLPDFELLCGGFPCQAFSIAGKRSGFDDARGTLFFEIARIAAVKRPPYLLLENVPGLLSHDQGRTFAVILNTLAELGYDVCWQVLNSKDFGVPQSRKRVFIVGFLREMRVGEVLSFTESNPATLKQILPGSEGNRVYDTSGVSVTLTSSAGGFGGKTGLYVEPALKESSNREGVELPVKVQTKSGYQIAQPGDSIDTSYPNLNSRRGRVGKKVAHTLTCTPTQAVFIDLNPDPKITAHARCITARIDAGIGKHKGERSGVLMMGPRAVLTPDRDEVRQQGRRIKEEEEPMYTLTAQDRHGVWWLGVIRRLTPLECFRLQGFTDAQFFKVAALGLKDGQLYKLAGNAVSVPVISALGLVIKSIEAQYQLERMCNS